MGAMRFRFVTIVILVALFGVDGDAWAQRRGGGRRGGASRSSHRSSVRASNRRPRSVPRNRATSSASRAGSRSTVRDSRRTYTRPTHYGSVRHGSSYTRSRYGRPLGGTRSWSRPPVVGGVQGPRGGEARVVRGPAGAAGRIEGPRGGEVVGARGPRRGAVRVEGPRGRAGAVVWGPHGVVGGARGPYGGVMAGAGNWRRGGMVRWRPTDFTSIVIGGSTYYGWGGYCYRRVYHDGDLVYVGIRAPVGWFVATLPVDCNEVTYEGNTYYYYDDVYYLASEESDRAGYIVTDPPPGAATESVGADEPNPFDILRQMSDYLGSVPQLAVEATDTIDDISANGARVQLATTRRIVLVRPDRLHVDVVGDITDRRIVFSGTTLSWHDRGSRTWGTAETPGGIDAMIDWVAETHGMTIPLADLFCSTPYDAVVPATETGRYLGTSDVEGATCHHLAFEGRHIDWQVWIEVGSRPFPRKFAITYKEAPRVPRYRAVLRNWDASPRVDSALFVFQPPSDAERVEMLPIRRR